MKGYRKYMDSRTVDQQLHEKIMQKVMENPKPVSTEQDNKALQKSNKGSAEQSRKKSFVWPVMAAACAAIIFFGVWLIPGLLSDSDGGGDFSANQPNGQYNGSGVPYSDGSHIVDENPEPAPNINMHALVFNEGDHAMSASRFAASFAHPLTDEQFSAIFPSLDGSRFETRVSYWLPQEEHLPIFAEVFAIDLERHVSITAAEAVTSFANPFDTPEELQISYVHGVEVIAFIRETELDFSRFGSVSMVCEDTGVAINDNFPMQVFEILVRAEFVLGGVGYNVQYFGVGGREASKEALTAIVNQIIYGGEPDWSVLADPVVPELLNEIITLEQAQADPDFGAFMPANVPQAFRFDSARRTLNQWDNAIRTHWHRYPTFDNISWAVQEPTEHDLAVIVSTNDRHKFDVSLYSIPWFLSVPDEVHMYFQNPVFLAEEMSLEIVQARARWADGERGQDAGWRIDSFGVLYGDVLIRVSASGLSPEQLWEMLP